jgi:hypothetical protein
MDAAMDGVGRAGQSRIQEFKNSRIQEVLLKKRSKKEPTRRPLLLFNVRRRIARERVLERVPTSWNGIG